MKYRTFAGLFLAAILSIFPLACSDRYNNSADRDEPGTVDSAVTDSTLTADVKVRLADDDLVKARNIDVNTDNAIVSLRGEVASQQEADRAVKIASNVEGVRSVRSFLKVEPASGTMDTNDRDAGTGDTPSSVEKKADEVGNKLENEAEKLGDKATDAAITTTVKMKLAADEMVDATAIDVDTTNGVVTLTGKVSSKAAESRAVKIASSVENVRSVKANLTVTPDSDSR